MDSIKRHHNIAEKLEKFFIPKFQHDLMLIIYGFNEKIETIHIYTKSEKDLKNDLKLMINCIEKLFANEIAYDEFKYNIIVSKELIK